MWHFNILYGFTLASLIAEKFIIEILVCLGILVILRRFRVALFVWFMCYFFCGSKEIIIYHILQIQVLEFIFQL